MSDVRLRELERLATTGDRHARQLLKIELLRHGRGRDPRTKPRPGDTLRVPRHAANFNRWDERRVVSCGEAEARPEWKAIGVACIRRFIGKDHCGWVHWARSRESFERLADSGLARQRVGTIMATGWKAWARSAEVVYIGDGDG